MVQGKHQISNKFETKSVWLFENGIWNLIETRYTLCVKK